MIDVLWIDDESILDSGKLSPMGEEFVNSAYSKGINITPMLTYEEGVNAIARNPQKWCAVILDIHNQKATKGSPSDGFDEARDNIVRIQAKNEQSEPYIFVLSGNKKYQTESSTLRQLPHCSKNVYDKNNGDYKKLFEDILKIQNISPLYHCQNQYYDVLAYAKKYCGDETWKRLLLLIYEITIKNIKDNPSLFNDIRKILEDIMDGLQRVGYSFFKVVNGKDITLNNLSRFISEDDEIPEYVKRSFHSLVRVTQDGSHSKSVQSTNRMDVDYDVKNQKCPYLLRSSLFELCNILIWMSRF